MKSFSELLQGVAAKQGIEGPVESSIFAKALGRGTVVENHSGAQELTDSLFRRLDRAAGINDEHTPPPRGAAAPGDGADPTSALNHDADQHVGMRQYQNMHEKLRAVHELLHSIRSDSIAAGAAAPNAPHAAHCMHIEHAIDHALTHTAQATTHLGNANKALLQK